MSVLAWSLRRLLARRRRRLERVWRDPQAVQEATLVRLVRRARHTVWGRAHGYREIRGIADYQRRVPAGDYLAFQPLWRRALDGEADVTWPGRPRQYAKTSGTTAGDKYIPLTPEALRHHRRGGLDTLLFAFERGGDALLDGPLLFMGGSTAVESIGRGAVVGDLSGLIVRDLPTWLRSRYSPGSAIAARPDWEARLAATARLVLEQDLRMLSGMPSWMVVLLERVRGLAVQEGHPWPAASMWPRLEVLVHGGVRMDPYRRVLGELIGRPLHLLEVYPASEAFVALQVHAADPGLTLLLDAGVFFEFVPVHALDRPDPPRLPVGDLRVGDAYAVLVTTPAGLWSYGLGDTVRVVSLDPPQVVITGRTRHFVNAFGENVIVEEVEQAMAMAAEHTGAEVVEYTVAPAYPDSGGHQARHEWAVEFRVPPADPTAFGHALDQTLRRLNTDYRTKRTGAVGMGSPAVTVVPAGAFHRWLASRGQLGDQHKVPRVMNHREVLEGVLGGLRSGRPGEHPD